MPETKYLTDEQRDRLLLRMAAHQYRMGRIVWGLGMDSDNVNFSREDMNELGRQQQWLSQAIEESSGE